MGIFISVIFYQTRLSVPEFAFSLHFGSLVRWCNSAFRDRKLAIEKYLL